MNFQASQDAFARAVTDPESALPVGITSRRGEADATRFAVYRNNVMVGLTKTLEKRFPVVTRLVGADFFAGMARAYVRSELPSSPVMFEYGDSFANFLSGYAPAAGVRYLADVARVEAAWTRAYHAEDAAALTVADLAAIPAEELGAARLTRHPAAELVRSEHPVGSIWAAHQAETVEPPREWIAEAVLITRPVMDVSVRVVPERDAAFAQAVLGGATLADAAETALQEHQDFDFGAALVGLVSLGAFRASSNQRDKT
jgi:hypothetical protein